MTKKPAREKYSANWLFYSAKTEYCYPSAPITYHATPDSFSNWRHCSKRSLSSLMVSARNIWMRIWRKLGIPLKMGEAAKWRRVWRMARSSLRGSSSPRSFLICVRFIWSCSFKISILSSSVNTPLPTGEGLGERLYLISRNIQGRPKVALPIITASTP